MKKPKKCIPKYKNNKKYVFIPYQKTTLKKAIITKTTHKKHPKNLPHEHNTLRLATKS
jgi:hypothetical protein